MLDVVHSIWLAVPALCVIMYVVLDGYDLGIGVLTLFERDRARRRSAVEVVAQTWDINESWLILLGLSLWSGFPAAFGAMLPHVYIPVIVMLLSLAVRGFSTELISQRTGLGDGWVRAFGIASLTAALAQGAALGLATQAVLLDTNGRFMGSADTGALGMAMPWLGAIALTVIYSLLGAAYLPTKLDSMHSASRGRSLLIGSVVLAALFVLLMPVADAPLTLTGGRGVAVIVLLVISALAAVIVWRQFRRAPATAFGWTAAVVIALLLAIFVGRYPVLVAPDLTVQEAGAPMLTMWALLIAVGINVLLNLFYTFFAHRVFRGPIEEEYVEAHPALREETSA